MSDATALDQEARDRIVHGGLDEGLFVEAGAGTGKTTQLVGRVVALVVDRGVPLREIAAITFTEAAASELRDRIREELERRAATDEDSDVRQRCLAALADADVAAIGTLHSFAQRLLGEHPVEVGIPPRVEVLDEVRSAIEFQTRWDRFVDELFDDPAYTSILVRAVLLDVHVDRIRGSSLRDVAVVFGESWDRLDRIASEENLTPLPLARDAAKAALQAVQQLPEQCHDPADRLLQRIQANAQDVDRVASALDLADDDGVVQELRTRTRWAHGSLGRAAAWDDINAAKERLKAADALCDRLVDQAADGVLRVLASAVARFTKRAADERRQEGRLEFHDLLVLARRLLRTSPSARDALRHRYTRLLLDEFQDTDPIQIELAVLVASLPASVETPDEALGDLPWALVPTDPERLFFVGDPKQSIYRFRRADIRLFLAARDRFGGPGAVALTRNFRTVRPVLDWVNHVFGEVMKDTEAQTQPGYTPLVAERAPGESDHRVVLVGEPHDKGEGLKAVQLRELEARDVARAVATILRRPDDWPVYDAVCKKWRAPRPSEIAIMVPTRTSLAVLQSALEKRSVPYRLETGSLVYETQEVRDLCATIRVVVDPTDSIALVGALRSAVFGCADTELFQYKQAGGRWDVRSDPPASLPADHPVVEAMRVLRLLWEQRWWISPSELVERLIRERRLFELAFAHRRPRDAWRRLRFVLDQTRLFSESQGGDLVEFVKWSDLQRRDTSRVHEPLLPETDDDSVRIMTIHAAKGLEFPIAIVSGTTTQHGARRGGVGVHFDDDDTVELRLKAKLETERFDQRRDLEDEMDGHEKQRLLYVATTRARDHLLVSAHHNVGTKSFAATIWEHSQPTMGTLCRPFVAPSDADDPLPSAAPVVVADPTDTAEARVEWIVERARMLMSQGASRSISATSIARAIEPNPTPQLGADLAAETAARAELEAEDDAAEDAVIEDLRSEGIDGAERDRAGGVGIAHPWRRGRAGTAFGRAVHEVLQSIDFETGAGIEALAHSQCSLEGVPDAVDAVVAHVSSALESDIVQLAARGPSWRESYVATTVGDRVVEGYIDLLLRTPEGLVVVDYKTDGVKSDSEAAARVEHYRLQGATYALALEASTGLPVVDVRFLFTGANGSGTDRAAIDLPIPDLRAAIDDVRALLTAVSS